MNPTISALRAILKDSLDRIDAGNTNISEEHANVLIDLIGTINKPKSVLVKLLLVNIYFILIVIDLIIY